MTNSTFSDFYEELLKIIKTFEEKNTIIKVEEDLASKIIQIFGEGTDIVVRAKNGLENVVELGYTVAEHHPYWGLLHNCSQISKTVLDKWDENISKEELSEIQWMINELQNSCIKLQDKINQFNWNVSPTICTF